MYLRRLKQKDGPLMLEWMHDDDVVHYMKNDFKHKTLRDCYNFIENSHRCENNLHLAVADENDDYMGTVSLKNIENGFAEFAITMRKIAMGKGYAATGMKELIQKGFNELGLHTIYWYVNPDNQRAIRFYDKNGYQRVNDEGIKSKLQKRTVGCSREDKKTYTWYQVEKDDFKTEE